MQFCPRPNQTPSTNVQRICGSCTCHVCVCLFALPMWTNNYGGTERWAFKAVTLNVRQRRRTLQHGWFEKDVEKTPNESARRKTLSSTSWTRRNSKGVLVKSSGDMSSLVCVLAVRQGRWHFTHASNDRVRPMILSKPTGIVSSCCVSLESPDILWERRG